MSDDIFETDVVVIGAGVVGLAVAATLARSGRETLILERNRRVGEETSARNSEVIHAGLYYPPGSLKAALCARGRDLLYAWCEARGVAHRRLGKLIVATEPAEEPALEKVATNAAAAGVALDRLSGAETRRLEPALRAVSALSSPLTGVIDSHGFMLSLQGEAEAHGAALAFESPVGRGAIERDAVRLRVGGAASTEIRAGLVVNVAGLWAPTVAARIEGAAPAPEPLYLKGNYYALTGLRAPFTRLIYPAPVEGGLGVHLTLDMAGRARFGPDVEQTGLCDPDALDYTVDPARAESFYAAIRRYWPGLPDGALRPDYCGVRPKLAGSNDFEIRAEAEGRLIHLFGVESPGLTAALAIAEKVEALAAAI